MRAFTHFFFFLLIVSFLLSCTKAKNGIPYDSMTAGISEPGSSKITKFIADTCWGVDTTYGQNRFISITATNVDSGYALGQIFFEINNYRGTGGYVISLDTNNAVYAFLGEYFPGSIGPTFNYIQATNGTIGIVSTSATSIVGDFDVYCGKTHYSGVFNAVIR